ncbi:caspase domain-containing protein, partial [Fomitopsis serialis]|uniref:caspase domain-containing protein n=1 Tax=Fomitopsis serialis TaxID=139415 RepID=UPI0020079D11
MSRSKEPPCLYSELQRLCHIRTSHVANDVIAASHTGQEPLNDRQLEARIFALVIAIDNYRNSEINKLQGCVPDAEDLHKFLEDTLKIPSHRIRRLYNERATRRAILDTFISHFIENIDIQPGDTMILFYAGHGDRETAPEGWKAPNNMVETISPYDVHTKDTDGNAVLGIPDWTIDCLMQRLAKAKGDNIVAIFDCCHSGGALREITEDAGVPRAL